MKTPIKFFAIALITIFSYSIAQAYRGIIWIPCSGKGTVVAVDDSSYRVLGEYLTTPPTKAIRDSASPSRYAINYNGDVVFGHRKTGGVTILHYKKGDGVQILPWGVDQVVKKFIYLPRFGDTRHISVTTDKKIIVGSSYTPNFFYILDGKTYEVIDSISDACSGGYGGLVKDQYLWSVAKHQNKTLRYNLQTGEQHCFDLNMSYGITSLADGSVFNTRYSDKLVCKLLPNSDTVVAQYNIGRTARGISYNPYNDKLYIANSLEDYITEIDTLGNITDTINLEKYLTMTTPPFLDPTGILINKYDILVTCFYQDTVLVYDTQDHKLKAKINIGPNANPYFYNSTTNLSFIYAELLTANTIDFNRELCENERSDYITITNNGFTEMKVFDYSIEGDKAAYFDMTSNKFPFSLKPKESKTLAVWAYRPTEVGENTATLKIYSNAINAEEDSSISIPLHSEFQRIKYNIEAFDKDTLYIGTLTAGQIWDSTLSVLNKSSIPAYLVTRLTNNNYFKMKSDSLFESDSTENFQIDLEFISTGLADGLYTSDLILKNECRLKKITLLAKISCQVEITADDTIFTCGKDQSLVLEDFIKVEPKSSIDSVIITDDSGKHYNLTSMIQLFENKRFHITVYSGNCSNSKDIYVVVPNIQYTSYEEHTMIPGNPILIGPDVNFEQEFNNSNIDYYWTPKTNIVTDDDIRQIAVNPDTTTLYSLKIVVDSRCNYDYSCLVKVFTVGVKDYTTTDNYIRIYPNPANEYLTLDIQTNEVFKINKIRLINNLGQVSKEILINTGNKHFNINTLDLPNGNYLISVDANDNNTYQLGTVIIYR